MIVKLEAYLRQAEQKLISEAASGPLDDLRVQAGLIKGLRIALELAQQNDKELTHAQKS